MESKTANSVNINCQIFMLLRFKKVDVIDDLGVSEK